MPTIDLPQRQPPSSAPSRRTASPAPREHHEYEPYLAVEDVDHSRAKTKSPQTNGIVERFHKTVLDEFYRVAFRKKIYGSISDLQRDLDDWVRSYNEERPHQGRWCFGKTPMQTFLDATPLAKEKMIAA
jgi:transposase InsO family protein